MKIYRNPITKAFTWNEYCPQGDNSCQSYRPTPDVYNPDHVYYYPFSTEGGTETIYGISDECCWGDNQSGLTFEIYKSSSSNLPLMWYGQPMKLPIQLMFHRHKPPLISLL